MHADKTRLPREMQKASVAFPMRVNIINADHRGIAKRGGNDLHVNAAELLLKDYPYAEDGLLVWDAIVRYFDEYLRMYYSNDTGSDKQVSTV